MNVKLVRPFDSVISCVIEELVNISISPCPGVKFYRRMNEYILEFKRSSKVKFDSFILCAQVCSKKSVAMIHGQDYSLNKLSFNKVVNNLNDTSAWFLNEYLSDVTFNCSNRKNGTITKYPGHRMILGSLSESIKKLLDQSTVNEIDLTSYSNESVHTLIRFLYTNQLIIDYNNLTETLEILNEFASKNWPDLVDQLGKLITIQTVLPIYQFTLNRVIGNVWLLKLRDYCLTFIDANIDNIIEDDSFVTIKQDTLITILQRDTLLTREIKLFQGITKWAKAKCLDNSVPINSINQLNYIGKSLDYIRFNAMTANEFASGPAVSGLISDQDTIKFLMHVAIDSKDNITIGINLGKPRNQQFGWTNGQLDIKPITVTVDEIVETVDLASAPIVNELNQLASSFDENIETKLNVIYPNLKDN